MKYSGVVFLLALMMGICSSEGRLEHHGGDSFVAQSALDKLEGEHSFPLQLEKIQFLNHICPERHYAEDSLDPCTTSFILKPQHKIQVKIVIRIMG